MSVSFFVRLCAFLQKDYVAVMRVCIRSDTGVPQRARMRNNGKGLVGEFLVSITSYLL